MKRWRMLIARRKAWLPWLGEILGVGLLAAGLGWAIHPAAGLIVLGIYALIVANQGGSDAGTS
jgi:hypothetical protein